jgi:hypothetical protein
VTAFDADGLTVPADAVDDAPVNCADLEKLTDPIAPDAEFPVIDTVILGPVEPTLPVAALPVKA